MGRKKVDIFLLGKKLADLDAPEKIAEAFLKQLNRPNEINIHLADATIIATPYAKPVIIHLS